LQALARGNSVLSVDAKRRKISGVLKEFDSINIVKDDFHGEWKYVIHPNKE